MKTGSKLFLILLFVGLMGNAFAMKKQLTQEWEAAAKRMKTNFVCLIARSLNNFIYKTPCSNKLTICLKNWWIRNISQVKFLDLLPKEILEEILTMDLSSQDLARVCVICTKLNTLAEPIKLTKEWEAAQDDLNKLINFIQRRGNGFKKYDLQHIFYACLQVAQAKLNDEDFDVREAALFVLEALVKQGQYFGEAFQAVQAKLKDEILWVRIAALLVLKALVEQGLYYLEVLQEALAQLNDESLWVRIAALLILKSLVEQRQYFGEAFQAVQAKLKDEDCDVRVAALDVLHALVEQGQYYPEVLQAALDMLNDEDCLVRKIAEELKSLVEEKMEEQNYS